MYDAIYIDKIKAESLTALTKVRWDRMGKEPDQIKRQRDVEEIEEEDKIDSIANLDRRVVNIEKKEVNIRLKRCTSTKGNRRVIFLSGRPSKEETVLDVRLQKWMESVRSCRATETVDGVQKTEQLDHSQKLGLKSLEEKVQKGALHIGPSDKGKGLVAMTRDMYDNMAKVHVEGDSKVTWRELELAQKEVRNHGRALTRVFGLGKMEGKRNRSRCFNNISS